MEMKAVSRVHAYALTIYRWIARLLRARRGRRAVRVARCVRVFSCKNSLWELISFFDSAVRALYDPCAALYLASTALPRCS